MKALIPALFLALPSLLAASGPPLMPLETGNVWVYRDKSSGETRTISVGTGLATLDGRHYFHLRGYVDQPLWVREAPNGSLFYFNEETGAENLLTSFESVDGGWAEAPFRICEQESQPAKERHKRALVLHYRSFGCADAGILEEHYAENIGMTRRVEQSIAGPRVFELESARLGRFVFAPQETGRFHLETQVAGEDELLVTLRMITGAGHPVTLRFPSGQEIEITLRDASGNVVRRWSDGRFFTQAEHEVTIGGHLAYEERFPLKDRSGQPLRPGEYTLEGAILGGAYAATLTFTVYDWL